MNEEMNNSIVNDETNTNNNYESPKSNNGVKVLLIVLIILVLCLIGLTCYKMFIYDKKNDNKSNGNTNNNAVEEKENNSAVDNSDNSNNVVEEKNEEVNDKLVQLSINDTEVQKYFNYINSEGRYVNGTFEEELNYISESKNKIAYEKILDKNLIKREKCSLYADYIESISPMLLCDGFDYFDEETTNSDENATTSVINGADLKTAVEIIFGKNGYEAKSFSRSMGSFYEYNKDVDKYVGIRTRGGGIGPTYETKLIKAEKNSTYLYLYEKFTKKDVDVKQDIGTMKHIFEKNSYDSNYHYVKSEKA